MSENVDSIMNESVRIITKLELFGGLCYKYINNDRVGSALSKNITVVLMFILPSYSRSRSFGMINIIKYFPCA
jgi:hypothetical protein